MNGMVVEKRRYINMENSKRGVLMFCFMALISRACCLHELKCVIFLSTRTRMCDFPWRKKLLVMII